MGQVAKQIGLRISQGFFVAIGVSTLTFCLLVAMPGDLAMKIAMAQYGEDGLTDVRIEQVRRETGLEQPKTSLYFVWLKNTLSFDLGYSMVSGEPVKDTLITHMYYSLKLAGATMVISMLIAFPLGILAGLKPGSAIDLLVTVFSSLAVSVPGFLIGACLIVIFAIKLKLLPAAGYCSPESIILPAITLALVLAAVSCRVIRTSVITVKDSCFLLFARIKGLSRTRVFLDHGLKSGAVPIITFLGLQLAHVMDGVVVLENLFNWPGVGLLLLESIRARDLTMIQGVTLVIGLVYVGVNLITDLLCTFLDPRHLAAGGDI